MLENNGDLNHIQRTEFRHYMAGYAHASHSLNHDELRKEAMRYVEDEREDFARCAFGEVIKLINVTVSDLMEKRG